MTGDCSYRFLDCGDGRRLEVLGGVRVARPAPAADWPRALSGAEWDAATLRFDRDAGWLGTAPDDWSVAFGGPALRLRPAKAGQIGVFPEHFATAERLTALLEKSGRTSLRALNLFAYTGLMTLSLAALSRTAETVHVDGSSASVRQARENADLSGLGDRRVRWLVDDVLGFLRRETRRARRYDVIVADPPAFGRGGKGGGEWRLDRDMPTLLSLARELLAENGVLCVSCHSEGWSGGRLAGAMRRATGVSAVEEWDAALTSGCGGNALPCGVAALAMLGV